MTEPVFIGTDEVTGEDNWVWSCWLLLAWWFFAALLLDFGVMPERQDCLYCCFVMWPPPEVFPDIFSMRGLLESIKGLWLLLSNGLTMRLWLEGLLVPLIFVRSEDDFFPPWWSLRPTMLLALIELPLPPHMGSCLSTTIPLSTEDAQVDNPVASIESWDCWRRWTLFGLLSL